MSPRALIYLALGYFVLRQAVHWMHMRRHRGSTEPEPTMFDARDALMANTRELLPDRLVSEVRDLIS